jgi:hypothetical protein
MPPEYHRSYERLYFQDEKNRKRRNALMREYSKAPGTKDRHKARWLTARAIRTGKLTKRPCEVCKATTKVQAHHDDYSKPLDVRWLCLTHHVEHHAKAEGREP